MLSLDSIQEICILRVWCQDGVVLLWFKDQLLKHTDFVGYN